MLGWVIVVLTKGANMAKTVGIYIHGPNVEYEVEVDQGSLDEYLEGNTDIYLREFLLQVISDAVPDTEFFEATIAGGQGYDELG